MTTAVRYCSRTGNARKLAEGIADALGVKAADVSHKLAEDVDILFLCDSVYWNGVDGKVKEFLKNPGRRIGSLVNVSTAAFKESSYPQVKAIAEKAGISVSPHEFHCKGSFMALHKGRPNEEDVAAAQQFAEQIAGTES